MGLCLIHLPKLTAAKLLNSPYNNTEPTGSKNRICGC